MWFLKVVVVFKKESHSTHKGNKKSSHGQLACVFSKSSSSSTRNYIQHMNWIKKSSYGQLAHVFSKSSSSSTRNYIQHMSWIKKSSYGQLACVLSKSSSSSRRYHIEHINGIKNHLMVNLHVFSQSGRRLQLGITFNTWAE